MTAVRVASALLFVACALTCGTAAAQPPRIEVQAVAETGCMPKGVILSPDGKHAYVTNFGQGDRNNVDVFDAATLTHEETIHVPGNVVESVLSPDGWTLYASNFLRDSVMFIDLRTRKVTHEIATGKHPKILVLSPDGRSLFAANWTGKSVSQIDVPSAKVVRTLPTGLHPRGMVMTQKGVLYVANFDERSIDVFEGPDLSDHHRLETCPIPRHLALSPDEKLLFVSCFHDSMIEALDLATEKVVHAVDVGSSPKSLEASRDGRWVWSADYGRQTNSVSVIDTEDWTARVYSVPGMDHGSGIAVFPDGKRALVTGWYDNHVYLVGFEGTGGDPRVARAKIQSWIRRPHHP